MSKKESGKKRRRFGETGFEEWGGYMNAKISKLEAQFKEDEKGKDDKTSNIFNGVSIFVNGYTEPSADELRCLMLEHGGVFHHYYRPGKTTHVVASSLPNAKLNQMKTMKVVKCEWVTDSIKAGKLLDYRNYLLQSDFPMSRKDIMLRRAYALGRREGEIPKTAADDGYLSDFYKNSRLHYISTLATMLKQCVQEMRDNPRTAFSGRRNLQLTEEDIPYELFDETIIMHVDLDCFFVSVALRNHPELKGKPVAVTHSKGNLPSDDRSKSRKFEIDFYRRKMKGKLQGNQGEPSGTGADEGSNEDDVVDESSRQKSSMSEIASCSYEARKAGVRKGMYLGRALKICPNLKTVPYDFEGYKEVSLTFYKTVAEYTLDIEARSCDELLIDCNNLIKETRCDPMKFASVLRKEIEERTQCTCSIGVGSNVLQARLATKHAKPNGQFYLTPDIVDEFMRNLSVDELPGVGRTLSAKLKSMNIKTCEDLQEVPMGVLKKEFGEKTGEALYQHCRGEDDRKVNFSHERKSISAEVNYGIRFNDDAETELFLKQLSAEVSKRLKDAKMIGRSITFKAMFRAKHAPLEAAKFLGHGACDSINRSVSLPSASDDADLIARHVISLYHQTGIPPNELRGIGIQVTKLENSKRATRTLEDYLSGPSKPATATSIPRVKIIPPVKPPTPSQIDPEVLASLPDDIRLEVIQEYGLTEFFPEEESREEPPPPEPEAINDSVKSLFHLSLKDMRTMIKEWVKVESVPQDFDIDMLKKYLCTLVDKKKLETVSVVMSTLKRHIRDRRSGDDRWKKVYEKVVEAVQSSMTDKYGKFMSLDVM